MPNNDDYISTGVLTGKKISVINQITKYDTDVLNSIKNSLILLADKLNDTNNTITVEYLENIIIKDVAKIYDNKISGLQHQIIYNYTTISGAINSLTDVTGEQSENIEEIKRLYNSIYNNLSIQISKSNTKVSGLEYKLNTTLTSYSDQINSLSGSISQYTDDNNSQLNNISGIINNLSSNISTLSGSVNSGYNSLSRSISNITNNISGINNIVDNNSNNITDLKDKIDILMSKIKYKITYNLQNCDVEINGERNPKELTPGTYDITIIPDVGYEIDDTEDTIEISSDANISYICNPKTFNVVLITSEHCEISSTYPSTIKMGNNFTISLNIDNGYKLNNITALNASYKINNNNIAITPNGNGDINIKINVKKLNYLLFIDSSYINDFTTENDIMINNNCLRYENLNSPISTDEIYIMSQVPSISNKTELYFIINKEYINQSTKKIIYNNEEYKLSDKIFGGKYDIDSIEDFLGLYYKCKLYINGSYKDMKIIISK